MARILLAWQIGAGYGRLAQMAPVAAALHDLGHDIFLAAPAGWLADPQAQALTRQVMGESLAGIHCSPDGFVSGPASSMSAATYADILRAWSFDEASQLEPHIRQWLALFEAIRPDAILIHHAPGAALAAQMAGLRLGQFGDGYVVPKAAEPMPHFTPWAAPDEGTDCLACDSDRPLASIRAVCRVFGKDAPDSLAAWLQSIPDYLCTFPFLDHYGEREGAYYYGIHRNGLSGQKVQWPGGPDSLLSPKVLVYLSAEHPLGEVLLQALAETGWPVVMHQAWSQVDGPGKAVDAVPGRLIRRYAQPIDMDQAMDEATVFVSHAPHLSCAQALARGLPMLLLPVNVEQEMVAIQLVRLGVAVMPAAGTAEAILETLRALPGDERIALRALALAQAMKPFDAGRAVAELADDFCHDMELTS